MSYNWEDLTVTEGERSYTNCDCCSSVTTALTGDVSCPDGWLADYVVRWTDSHPERGAAFTLMMGDWSDDAPSTARWIMRADFLKSEDGFMIANARDEAAAPEIATYLNRDDIVGTPFASDCFAIIDAIFMKDSQMEAWRS